MWRMCTDRARGWLFRVFATILAFVLASSGVPVEALAEAVSVTQTRETMTVAESDVEETAPPDSVAVSQSSQTVAVTSQPEHERVTFHFDMNVPTDDAHPVAGTMDDFTATLDGNSWTLPQNLFGREGFEFKGWSTTVDGRDIEDNKETKDVDESFAARPVADGQEFTDTTFMWQHTEAIDDVTQRIITEPCDLAYAKVNGVITLYAQWSEVLVDKTSTETVAVVDTSSEETLSTEVKHTTTNVPSDDALDDEPKTPVAELACVTVSFDANGGTGSMEDVIFTEEDKNPLPLCQFEQDNMSFDGWDVTTQDKCILTIADGAHIENLIVAYSTDADAWKAVSQVVDLRTLAGESEHVTLKARWKSAEMVFEALPKNVVDNSDKVDNIDGINESDSDMQDASVQQETNGNLLSELSSTLTMSEQPSITRYVTLVANGPVADDVLVRVDGDVASMESPACPFTWERHEFAAWNTKADGSGREYLESENIDLLAGTMLYAQWRDVYPDVSEELDFTNFRLIVGSEEKPSVGTVISEHDDVYLLGFENKFDTAWAYYDLLDKVDFVAPDIDVIAASNEVMSEDAMSEDNTFDTLRDALAYGAVNTPEPPMEYDSGDDVDARGPETDLSVIGDAEQVERGVIALIDSGVTGYDDAVTERLSVIGDVTIDECGHGTSMLVSMLAIEPETKVVSIKALNSSGKGTAASVYAAIETAIEMRVKVINLSLSAPATEGNAAVEQAIKDAYDAGIIVVGAAGNDGKDAKWYVPGKMGDEAVIAGSCDEWGELISTSNFGDTVDVFVPSASTSNAAAKVSAWLSVHGEFGHELELLGTDEAKAALGLVTGLDGEDDGEAPEHEDFSSQWTHPTTQLSCWFQRSGSLDGAIVGPGSRSECNSGGFDGIGLGWMHVKNKSNGSVTGDIELYWHQQNYGDLGWSSGATNQHADEGLRIEAFKLRLTGTMNTGYTMTYWANSNNGSNSSNTDSQGWVGYTGKSNRIGHAWVQFNKRSATQTVQVRYQNADGSWGSYSNAVNKAYNTGDTVSWSRAQDATYNAASTSFECSGAARTVQVSVSRRTATNTIRVRYQNADGSWGAYSNASSGANYVGQVRSWSRAQDATYNAGSASITDTASNQTKDVSISRKTATATVRYRLQNADGTYPGSYTNGVSQSTCVGGSRSYTYAQTTTHQAKSGTATIAAASSATGSPAAVTVSLDVPRKTATATVRYRLQNADGTYPSTYTNGVSQSTCVGGSRSYTYAQTSTHQAKSGTATIAAASSATASPAAVTVSLDVPRIVNARSVTVDPNGGKWNGSENVQSFTQNFGTTKAIPAPYREGYTFAGWAEVGYGHLNKFTNYDPSFDYSAGGTSVYNNSGNGMVTHAMQNSSAGAVYGSREVAITTADGTTSPGLGGYVLNTQSAANKRYVHVMVAKLPVGYSLNFAQNATGDGRTITWLTDTAGTGEYELYAYQHNCGSSGSFSTFGHVYVVSGNKPVTWQLAYSAMFDITAGTDDTYTFGDGDGTLTALWIPNRMRTLTFDANGGTCDVTSVSARYGTTVTDLPVPKRTGYEFRGWYMDFDGATSVPMGRAYMYPTTHSVHLSAYSDDWSQVGDASAQRRLISCTEGGGWNIETNGGNIQYPAYEAGTGYVLATGSAFSSLEPGWHDFDLIHDGSTNTIYVDGTEIASVACNTISYHPANGIFLGDEAAGSETVSTRSNYFTGKIANVVITDEPTLKTQPSLVRSISVPDTDVTLHARWEPAAEYSGVEEEVNPDYDGDGYGDNLAFSVPTSINAVAKQTGKLIFPEAELINLTDSTIRFSSIDVDASSEFMLVSDVTSAIGRNLVQASFGVGTPTQSLSDYQDKTDLPDEESWHVAAHSSLRLVFDGRIRNYYATTNGGTTFAKMRFYARYAN